jgi:hypothetical protein
MPVSEMKVCEAGAPMEEEIEVTPEMIDAGMAATEAFYFGNGVYAATEDFVASVFLAMLSAREVRR